MVTPTARSERIPPRNLGPLKHSIRRCLPVDILIQAQPLSQLTSRYLRSILTPRYIGSLKHSSRRRLPVDILIQAQSLSQHTSSYLRSILIPRYSSPHLRPSSPLLGPFFKQSIFYTRMFNCLLSSATTHPLPIFEHSFSLKSSQQQPTH